MIKVNCRKYVFTKRDIQKIRKLRKQNVTMDKIAEIFGCESAMSIYRICKENNISTKSTLYYDHDKIDNKIIKLYKEGKSSRDIEKIVGLNQGSVLDVLEANNIKRRESGYFNWDRHYTINENFFDKIDTHEKAYILGLFYTDGCVHQKLNSFIIKDGKQIPTTNSTISLTFHKRDGYLLEAISKIMGTNKPVIYRRNISQIALHSEKLCNDLIKLGCTPKKSLTIQFPTDTQLPKEFLSDFIRGLIDGDGWTSFKHKRRLGIAVGVCSGSPRFIVSLYYYLKYIYGIDGLVKLNGRGVSSCNRVTVDRKEDVKKIYDICYNNDRIAMLRKKEKLEAHLRLNKEYYDNYKPVVMLIDNIPHKRCYACRTYKILDDINFRNNKAKLDGYSVECRECAKKMNNEYYHRKQREKKERLSCLGP